MGEIAPRGLGELRRPPTGPGWGLAVLIACLASGLVLVTSSLFAQDERLAEPIATGGLAIGLETVASGLVAPNWGTSAPGDPGRLFVSDQPGFLWAIDLETGAKTVFLDLSGRLVDLGVGGSDFDERGFLGLAFHPDYEANGLLYTYTSEPVAGEPDFASTLPPGVDADHHSVIREWRVDDPGDPAAVADPASSRAVLRIEEPQFNHNAGTLCFGPDGLLYVSLGDGGGADDMDGQSFFGGMVTQGHGDSNGQNPGNVLGTVLRIDPLGSSAPNGQYAVPADNPFAPAAGPSGGTAGCADGFCDEIFAFGFRNPFRFSFDRATGELYLGDVGERDIEEVDVVRAGGNYGWNRQEGSFCFDTNGMDPGFAFAAAECPGVPPGSVIDPIAEYDTGLEGISVIGGFVYRGGKFEELSGRYVFGDYTAGPTFDRGRLFYLAEADVVAGGVERTSIVEFTLAERDGEPVDALGLAVLGFAEDARGDIFVLGNVTGVPSGETGVVLRIRPPELSPQGNCVPGTTVLCLLDRFRVTVHWLGFDGSAGEGLTSPLTVETGAFYFFSPTNLEVFVKVLDGRAVNGFFWFFFGGLTSLEFTVTVTDAVTGESRTARNPPGRFSADGNFVAFPMP